MSIYPTDSELDAACGAVVREWAHLESTLLHLYLGFLNAPDQFRARIVRASLPNLQARRKTLNRFAENYLGDEELRRFRVLMKRMSRLGRRRNMIAHASCIREGKNVKFVQFDLEGDEEFLFLEEVCVPFNNMKGWTEAIAKLDSDIGQAVAHILPRQLTSAKMHREPPGRHAQHTDPHQGESNREEL